MSRSDPDLDQAFAALRREEQRDSPSFASLWRAAGERRRHPRERRIRPLKLAAAAAPVLFLALLGAWLLRPGSSGLPPTASGTPAISAWRPATDFLLRTPGREILREPPPLGRGFSLGAESLDLSNPPSNERRSS